MGLKPTLESMAGCGVINWSWPHDLAEFPSRRLPSGRVVFFVVAADDRDADGGAAEPCPGEPARCALRTHLPSVKKRRGKSVEGIAVFDERAPARPRRIRFGRRPSFDPLPTCILP